MVPDLIDFGLECLFHELKKMHPFKGMHGGNHPETGWRYCIIIFQANFMLQVMEKDSPHPQVEVALGLTKTNPFPCKPP